MGASEVVRSTFEGELASLESAVVQLGVFAAGMLAGSMQALAERDRALADEVRRSDTIADSLYAHIEDAAHRLLALQHPMARDLRAVTGSIRIAVEFERIGDYSRAIAGTARRLARQDYLWELDELPAMALCCQKMLNIALRALTDHPADLTALMSSMDERVDAIWHAVREQCKGHMRRDAACVDQALELTLVARYLERIGDHIVNVAEQLDFMEHGRTGATGRRRALVGLPPEGG